MRAFLVLFLALLTSAALAQDDFDFVDEPDDFFDPTQGTFEEWLDSEDVTDWDGDGDIDEEDFELLLWLFDEATEDLDGDGFFDEEDFFLSQWLDGPDAADLNNDGEIDDVDFIISQEADGIFENEIFYVFVEPGFEHAIVEWETIEPGLIDTLILCDVELDECEALVVEADEEELDYEDLFEHLVFIEGLDGDTEYDIILRSVSLDGFNSEYYEESFRTRSSPDLRPAVILDLEYEIDVSEAFVFWETNRLTDARYTVSRVSDGVVVAQDTLDRRGEFVHDVELFDLQAGVDYQVAIESVPVNLGGLVDEQDVRASRTFTLTTRTGSSPVRLLDPPYEVVGPKSVLIEAEFNQSVKLRVDYGRVDNFRSSASNTTDTKLYKDSLSTTSARLHLVNIPRLKANTAYRYRIVAFSSSGDSLTTDPRGFEQWSFDWQFITSGAGDTLAPEIIEGPEIVARDRIAVLEWATDVETTGKVFFGTQGGTYGTSNEFSVAALNNDGTPALSDEHVVTLAGLEPGTTYQFRIESTGANGKKVSFTPGSSGKRAGLRQPPGGGGSFTTSNMPDTQRPVILSGPTVTSRTHQSAIVEWVTDEPADSQVRFGVADLGESVRSGASGTAHRMVLSNLNPDTRYRYSVASTDPIGNGPVQSIEGVLTTNSSADLTAPQIVSAPAVTYKNDRSATLRWVTDEAAATRINFGTSASTLDRQRELSGNGTEHIAPLTNLQPSTQYYFRVSASDLSNNGPTRTALDSFVTDGSPDLSSPVLTGLAASPSDSLAVIRWNTDELSDSFVEYGLDSLLLGTRVGDGRDVTAHEVALTNLTPNTRYYYKAGSVDPAHNPVTESATTSFVTLATADTEAPEPPSNLRAVAGSEQVVLRWSASPSVDVVGYDIERSLGEGNFEPLVTRVADTTYVDLGLTNGQSYRYRVVAVDRAATPNLSIETTVTAQPTSSAGPTTPAPVRAQGSLLTPTLVFDNATPFANGATVTYAIQVSADADFTTFAASVSGLAQGSGDGLAGQTAWTVDRQLTQGQTYYWRVRAEEGELLSPFSTTASFITQLEAAAVRGDFNGDRTVGLDDFFLFVDAFGKSPADAGTIYDLDSNGAIDLTDFFLFVDEFGKTASSKRLVASQAVDTVTRLALTASGNDAGTLATVAVTAEHVEDLRAFAVVLRYDAAQARFDGLDAGELLESSGQAPLLQVLSDEPGRLVLGNGLTSGGSATGSGALARLRFSVLDPRQILFTPTGYVQRDEARPAAVETFPPARLLPATFRLANNYPNPFNPATQIDYSIPTDGPVRLRLFDILGRTVRVLVDEPRHRAGYHAVRWDGRDGDGVAVASGVYFYALEADSFRRVRRMVLIK